MNTKEYKIISGDDRERLVMLIATDARFADVPAKKVLDSMTSQRLTAGWSRGIDFILNRMLVRLVEDIANDAQELLDSDAELDELVFRDTREELIQQAVTLSVMSHQNLDGHSALEEATSGWLRDEEYGLHVSYYRWISDADLEVLIEEVERRVAR